LLIDEIADKDSYWRYQRPFEIISLAPTKSLSLVKTHTYSQIPVTVVGGTTYYEMLDKMADDKLIKGNVKEKALVLHVD
jgi:D-tyrosyl-tRNA(Tyr) deacylase